VFFAGLASIIYVADTLELLRRAASKPDVPLGTILEMALFKLAAHRRGADAVRDPVQRHQWRSGA